jgi:hypothetical protein
VETKIFVKTAQLILENFVNNKVNVFLVSKSKHCPTIFLFEVKEEIFREFEQMCSDVGLDFLGRLNGPSSLDFKNNWFSVFWKFFKLNDDSREKISQRLRGKGSGGTQIFILPCNWEKNHEVLLLLKSSKERIIKAEKIFLM